MENNETVQNDKERFTAPEVEIILFDLEDVIEASGGFDGEEHHFL